MPGQFIKAQVTGIPSPKGVFVPARAITRGAEGPYVWKVDAQNKATVQPVTLGTPLVNLVRIIKGVAPADKIIVAGMLKLQPGTPVKPRSEEHTSELQSLMRISYAVFCLKKKKHYAIHTQLTTQNSI